ncbi:glycogen/starch/alpha-glucan phosphorylase [Rothia sp. ZJ932]|uniref:glycogen/starch/alpha-glucan phosphorylase n=1 Tax=Rothia sp. ZJ932 TaxID=2810516 RepID=UPI0019674A2D|nr:glycogen/starch/alpha-glucan phosphorylase [Rothia sp. ZJ932]QRZ60921.1 glycogen/starch/alpha-glucan phosphorylase [Rothia sp. ZJ932]
MSDKERPELSTPVFKESLLKHLQYTAGKDPQHSTNFDWLIALSYALRDQAVEPWFASTRRTWDEDRKRVYYLSMEFLIGRLMEDLATNLGIRDTAAEALADLGVDFETVVREEPDAALGNGGLGRLAACYMESMATVGCPAYGYGLRYEHGLFEQSFEDGRQQENPENWLAHGTPWDFSRPESVYGVGFGGDVYEENGVLRWNPGTHVQAQAFDTPIVGYGAQWANTLRLWAATPNADLFDLGRFNSGEFAAASEAETMARSLSRVLYPNDTTDGGKQLRLSQEYFLTSASVQDIVRRHLVGHDSLENLDQHAAIQMNDTHPAIAGPELIRILVDEHGFDFDRAVNLSTRVLGYTNHTLLPEALERWTVGLMRNVLPRHLQIIERLDQKLVELQAGSAHPDRLISGDQVNMGSLAFSTSHKVNGVSALHTELVKTELFPVQNALNPDRIVNVTNGITPRRWLKIANPALATLITETIGEGWETDLDRLRELEPYADDPQFLDAFGQTKKEAKLRFTQWLKDEHGIVLPTDALFDSQVKRMHEYKRQLLNIMWTIAHYQRIKRNPNAGWVPRVKIFAGKAAPSYHTAKDIIKLINDVAEVVNNDPETNHLLRIAFPPNYNVSMAEKLIPASDLSEQISTAGMEASGTGNMKFALNGALTIGTLDGANVEIREHVGAENFFLFGLTTEQVAERRSQPGHSRAAIEKSQALRDILQAVAEGTFSKEEPYRFGQLVDNMWNSDWFLVASDFDDYDRAQQEVEEAYRDETRWQRMAVLNIARMGYFSSDRSVRDYMREVWGIDSAL